MTIQNPHDKFFRESFSRMEIAREFLREYLPPAVAAEIQFDTLHLLSDSFIDDELRTHQTDILYQVALTSGDEANVYLLFEHKSYPDADVALQLLRYMVRIWSRQRDDGEVIRPIVPIVVYHGERVWQIATDFHSLLPTLPAGFEPHVPQFRYVLRDFSHRSTLPLRGNVWLLATLQVLRAILSPTIHQQLPQLVDRLFELVAQRNGVDFSYTILYYLSVGTRHIDKKRLRTLIEERQPKDHSTMLTLAEQWIEEGLEQGLEQGMQKQARIIAIRLLPLMDDEQIAIISDLAVEEVKTLRLQQNQSKSNQS